MADNASTKMETVKQAYAEIILNTSKEAAARIMVAERKAVCSQRELAGVKEDALRLLVQLKRMLDSKTVEAEVALAKQQRKVDELEDQLSEAEGIIVDLREELRMTQDKLEEVRCRQWLPLKQQTSKDLEDQPPPTFDDEVIAKTDDGRHYTVYYPSTENACGKRDLAEMMPQYACEDQPPPPPATMLLPSLISCAVRHLSTEDASSTKNPTEVTLQYLPGDQLPMSDGEKPLTSFQSPVPSPSNVSVNAIGDVTDVKSSKQRWSSCSSEPDVQDPKLAAANGSQAKSQEFETHRGQSFRDGSRRTRKNLKYQEAIAVLCRSSHGKHEKSSQLTSLSKCKTRAGKQVKGLVEVPVKKNHNHDNAQESSAEFANKSRYGELEGAASEEESGLNGNPRRLDSSLADCYSGDLQTCEDEESARISNEDESEKALKFTFQRKRKRQALTKLGNKTAPEGNNAMSRNSLEKEDAAKIQKSVLKDEQSKEGQQLLQIAHELMSMSANGNS